MVAASPVATVTMCSLPETMLAVAAEPAAVVILVAMAAALSDAARVVVTVEPLIFSTRLPPVTTVCALEGASRGAMTAEALYSVSVSIGSVGVPLASAYGDTKAEPSSALRIRSFCLFFRVSYEGTLSTSRSVPAPQHQGVCRCESPSRAVPRNLHRASSYDD